MAEKNQSTYQDNPEDLTEETAPDPSDSYERSHPAREGGLKDKHQDNATPTASPDRTDETVRNKQDGAKQINAHEDPRG